MRFNLPAEITTDNFSILQMLSDYVTIQEYKTEVKKTDNKLCRKK